MIAKVRRRAASFRIRSAPAGMAATSVIAG
jgi:hypothetical protein